MICDGYTQSGVFDGKYVEYRPMLYPERVAVLRRAASAAEPEMAIRVRLVPHVIYSDTGPPRHPLCEDLVRAVLGIGQTRQEREDADNLYQGARLSLSHPWLLKVSCEDCQQWNFFPLTGLFEMRRGKRQERPAEETLLCRTESGCPKGHVDRPFVLSPKNRRAIQFDRECRAVGQWPDDPIVRRNAQVIAAAMRKAKAS